LSNTTTHRLTADAHVLTLLGDELIGNDLLAVFELVKNAYDADATKVVVDMLLTGSDPTIRVRDNGSGMTEEIITNAWMRLGTSFKRGADRKPSPKFRRMPLGEKGVGRLAVQKLGSRATLVTRASGQPEYAIDVDWRQMLEKPSSLSDLTFNLEKRDSPSEFTGKEHGTLLEIKGLHRPDWPRRDLRALKRLLVSLKSPFEEVSDFDVLMRVPDREGELDNVLEIRDILNRANWVYQFDLDRQGSFKWSYEFRPPAAFAKQLGSNTSNADVTDERLLAAIKLPNEDQVIRHPDVRDQIHITAADLKGIGPISGRLYVYDRRRESFESGIYTQMREFLDEQTGIRVYRDGVRVFNYGEPGEDWLFLNASRINRPVERMGTNSVIGAVHLTLSESTALREKTNREGFDENVTFARLRWIMQSIVNHLDRTRRDDRKKLDSVISGKVLEKKADQRKPFEAVIEELRGSVKKHKLDRELGGQIDFIENGYREMRDVLARSAGALNLALVFHEVEREVNLLKRAIDRGEDRETLRKQASHVVGLLDAIGGLLKQTQKRKTSIRTLLTQVQSLNDARFKHHRVAFSCPVTIGEDKDFDVFGPVNLYLAALNNLVDNAIYWTRTAAERTRTLKPAILVRTLPGWYRDGNAVVVADNGPGFRIDPEQAIQPGITTKAGGMGLGLYYANLVMESTGGEVVIGDKDDFDLPEIYTGAVVALKFRRAGA
jgi:signal transduction histidine kinase